MPADHLDLILRVAVAGVLGAFLGLERELRGHVAGIRTHALVAIGAAMFSIAGAYGFTDLDAPTADPTRIAAQVAAGIGFVGAGAVLRSGTSIRGLTTAATLWVSAAIGVAAAAAAYGPLIAGVVVALLVLVIVRAVKPPLARRVSVAERRRVTSARVADPSTGPAVEVELQYAFAGTSDVVPAQLAGLDLRGSRRATLVDTFYDDSQLSLRQARCSLRVRQEDGRPPHLIAKGPSRRRPDGAKVRIECELALRSAPDDQGQLRALLELPELEEWRAVVPPVQLDSLAAIGALRNDRSTHLYADEDHSLELAWDQLEYPTGGPETRVEVEALSTESAELLVRADEDLRKLYGSSLRWPQRGKARELCARVHPDLTAAA
jgi:uncharacterized membrane protein YhiD involved in acid resistance